MDSCEIPIVHIFPAPPNNKPQQQQQQSDDCTPRVCASPCTLSPVCGDEITNGLNYGSCYVMSFSDGKQLGRRRDELDYKKDGDIQ
jgi:hypothetical protein